jgi:hypothetical protein
VPFIYRRRANCKISMSQPTGYGRQMHANEYDLRQSCAKLISWLGLITGVGDECLACRDGFSLRDPVQAKEPAPATGTNSATLASTALGRLFCAPAPCSRRLFLTLARRISRFCLWLQDGGVRSDCQVDPLGGHGYCGLTWCIQDPTAARLSLALLVFKTH